METDCSGPRKEKSRVLQLDEACPDQELLREAGAYVKGGGLAAFPTETVYGLGGNALDPEAAKKIYAAKGRPSDNPLIIHIASAEDIFPLVTEFPESARKLTEKFWPGPLTIILPKSDLVPYETTGGLDTVAVRFPDNRIAQGLIRFSGGYVAAPSANRSGRPSPTCAEHVREDLEDKIGMILDGGPVRIGLESTIVDFSEDIPVILRPGYIGMDMLKEVLGEVRTDPGILKTGKDAPRPKAPGMRYRHYAPRGELTILEGEQEDVRREIRRLVREHAEAGETAGIICCNESREAYPQGEVHCIGSRDDENEIARNLYGILRAFDASGVGHIYSESFFTPGMGQAIMNRLIKAAGGRIIRC